MNCWQFDVCKCFAIFISIVCDIVSVVVIEPSLNVDLEKVLFSWIKR